MKNDLRIFCDTSRKYTRVMFLLLATRVDEKCAYGTEICLTLPTMQFQSITADGLMKLSDCEEWKLPSAEPNVATFVHSLSHGGEA